MYQSFHRLFRKNYHKTACPVLQFKHLDILIWIYSHIQDAWFVEFSVLSFSYIQMHFSYFGIHTNVPSHICISYNQGVPVLPNTSFVFPCFVTPSRMFLVLSVPVLRCYRQRQLTAMGLSTWMLNVSRILSSSSLTFLSTTTVRR